MKAMLLAAVANATIPTGGAILSPAPTVPLNSIRHIVCEEGSGSGFIIGDKIIATALHVASLTHCKDDDTDTPLVTYIRDSKNDFALMAGNLPKVLPLKVSCEGYKTGKTYSSYGKSSWHSDYVVFGQYKQVATNRYTDENFYVGGLGEPAKMPGMRALSGYIVPGNSGGPIVDDDGRVVGINNVSQRAFFGMAVVSNGYSYELKNTILCPRPTE